MDHPFIQGSFQPAVRLHDVEGLSVCFLCNIVILNINFMLLQVMVSSSPAVQKCLEKNNLQLHQLLKPFGAELHKNLTLQSTISLSGSMLDTCNATSQQLQHISLSARVSLFRSLA